MVISAQDQEWIKLIAAKIAAEVTQAVLTEHVKNCPYGNKMKMWRMMLLAFCIGLGAATGGTAAWSTLGKLFSIAP